MRFSLSVSYQGNLFLYAITTADKQVFQFQQKSAPPGQAAPEAFTVRHPEKDVWTFEQELDEEFKADVIRVLKRTKL